MVYLGGGAFLLFRSSMNAACYLLSLNSSFPGEAAEEVRGWYFYILNLGGLQGKRLIWNNTGLGLPGLLILALP